ncbi:MAG: TolC family protein [Elusimicrobiota bacterium]
MKTAIILILAALSSPFWAWGGAQTQAPAGLESFTPAAYVAEVLKKSPEVEAARQSYVSALAQMRAAYGNAWLPQISFQGQAYPYGTNPFTPQQFLPLNMNASNMSYESQIGVNVFNSFQDSRAIKIKRLFLEDQAAALDLSRQKRALAAWSAYLGLFQAQEIEKAAESDLAAWQDQYALTQGLYQSGMKSRNDLLQSESDLDSSMLRLISAKAASKDALYHFNILIDQDPAAPAELSAPQLPRPPAASLRDALADAFKNRPEMRTAAAQAASAAVTKSQQWWGLFPFLSAGANYSESKAATFGEYSLGAGLQRPIYDAVFSLSLPTDYNFFSQWEQFVDARAAFRKSEEDNRVIERGIREDVFSSRVDLQSALDSYRISADREKVAKENLGIFSQRYRVGNVDALSMEQARSDFLKSENAFIQALIDAVSRDVKYRYDIGERLWP